MKVLMMMGFGLLTMFASAAQADYTCTTQSSGRYFRATAATEQRAYNQVVRQCVNDRVTRQRQCERNVRCEENRRRPDDRIGREGRCYLNRYPDICQNSPNNYCRDPLKHYNEHGRREGRIWGCRG
ncbi:MAG: hypothetical protein V4692_15800 [Bdellovibrionota bacterium]